MIAGKTLLVNTNLFSPNDHKRNDKIMYKYFRDKYDKIIRNLDFRLKKYYLFFKIIISMK